MKTFDHCLKIVLKHEGGFVNHPQDPGGATNLGITKATYERWVKRTVSVEDIKALTIKDVEPIYRKQYWDRMSCDQLPVGIDLIVFDFGVNAGPSRAVRFLQKIVKAKEDGVLGPRTISAALNIHNPVVAIMEFKTLRLDYYRRLSTFPVFGKGWSRRTEEVTEEALSMLTKF
jgi:lysozyme family protein